MYCRMIATVSLVNMHQLWSFPPWLNGKEPALQCRRHRWRGFEPWLGKIPGGGRGSPLQYFCLENPMDRGIWRATVHRVARSCRLKRLCPYPQPRHGTQCGCCTNNRTKEGKEFAPLVTANQTDKYMLRAFREKSDDSRADPGRAGTVVWDTRTKVGRLSKHLI